MNSFDKLYNIILEELEENQINNTESSEIHPTCQYCHQPVPIDVYEKAKAWHDEQEKEQSFKTKFKPDQCVCDKCAKELMDFYNSKDNWRGD